MSAGALVTARSRPHLLTYARAGVLRYADRITATLDYGAAIALAAGLLFATVGAVVMLVAMPDGLRGSFIGAVFASVGVLLVLVGASIQTETEQRLSAAEETD